MPALNLFRNYGYLRSANKDFALPCLNPKKAFPPILIVDLSGEISDPFTERFYFTEHFITRNEDFRDFQTIRPIALTNMFPYSTTRCRRKPNCIEL